MNIVSISPGGETAVVEVGRGEVKSLAAVLAMVPGEVGEYTFGVKNMTLLHTLAKLADLMTLSYELAEVEAAMVANRLRL